MEIACRQLVILTHLPTLSGNNSFLIVVACRGGGVVVLQWIISLQHQEKHLLETRRLLENGLLAELVKGVVCLTARGRQTVITVMRDAQFPVLIQCFQM